MAVERRAVASACEPIDAASLAVAVDDNPIDVEFVPDAVLAVPIARASFLRASAVEPSAIELTPVDSVAVPNATEASPEANELLPIEVASVPRACASAPMAMRFCPLLKSASTRLRLLAPDSSE